MMSAEPGEINKVVDLVPVHPGIGPKSINRISSSQAPALEISIKLNEEGDTSKAWPRPSALSVRLGFWAPRASFKERQTSCSSTAYSQPKASKSRPRCAKPGNGEHVFTPRTLRFPTANR